MAENHINKMDLNWLNAEELEGLCEKYGQPNVERTMIYITEQRHPERDLFINIPYTIDRLKKILDVVHGEFLNG